MKRKIIPLMICVFVLSAVLAGCAGNTNTDASASPGASAEASASAAASPAASAAASPSVSLTPDGFVIGKVTDISGTTMTLATVNPDGTKTITVDSNTAYSVSGSTKTATAADIAVGDVISVSLSGTIAMKIIDNGPDINPDPSAYVSPSPSETAAASPSA
jgi:hypothetical protein